MTTPQVPSGNTPAPAAPVTPDPAITTPSGSVEALAAKNAELLAEKKAEQAKRQAAEAELAAFRDDKRKREEKELTEQNQFKTLYEGTKAEKDSAIEENKKLKSQIADEAKRAELLKNLRGSVDPRLFDKLPLSDIVVGEDGKPDVNSVKLAAQKFEREFPDLIKRQSSGVLPPNSAAGSAGTLTYEEWLKLPTAEMRKRAGEMKTQ